MTILVYSMVIKVATEEPNGSWNCVHFATPEAATPGMVHAATDGAHVEEDRQLFALLAEALGFPSTVIGRSRGRCAQRCGSIVAVLHTFGSDLKWLMAHGALKKMWRYHLIRTLRQAHRAGKLRFPEKAAFLADYPRFNALLRRLYEMTWYAHIGASLRDPRFTLRYIGRYTKRAVLAEYRSETSG